MLWIRKLGTTAVSEFVWITDRVRFKKWCWIRCHILILTYKYTLSYIIYFLIQQICLRAWLVQLYFCIKETFYTSIEKYDLNSIFVVQAKEIYNTCYPNICTWSYNHFNKFVCQTGIVAAEFLSTKLVICLIQSQSEKINLSVSSRRLLMRPCRAKNIVMKSIFGLIVDL